MRAPNAKRRSIELAFALLAEARKLAIEMRCQRSMTTKIVCVINKTKANSKIQLTNVMLIIRMVLSRLMMIKS